MNRLSIIFPEKGRATCITEPCPEPKDNEVLVAVYCSTLSSGTEKANVGGDPVVNIATITPEAVFPRRSGYSSSGIVKRVGKNVTSVKPGDRVALSWTLHTSYICVPEQNVHKIEDENITFSDAAFCHIATFPLAAIRKCRTEIGEPAIVVGLGILGLLVVKLLRAAGACPIVALDPIPERRALALSYGADYAADSTQPGFAEYVKEKTHGGAKVAIEVTGVGAGLNAALDCMARFGRVALLGCTRSSDFTVDYYHKVHGPGITLIGAHTLARPMWESSPGMFTHHDDAMALLAMLSGKRITFRDLLGETHDPSEAQEVYTRLLNERNFPIVQFDWTRIHEDEAD